MSVLCRRLAGSVDVTVVTPSGSGRRLDARVGEVRVIRVPEFGRYASAPLCPTAPLELRRLRPDLVHLHFPNPMGDLAYLLSATRAPVVVTYHADIIKQKAFLPVYRPVLRALFGRVSRIIVAAEENVRSSSMLSEYRDRCAVIPYGVEAGAFVPEGDEASEVERLRASAGHRIALFVGAARYYKGLDVLLRAMVDVDGHLFVAGRGTGSQELGRQATDLGISRRVTFFDEVSESRLRVLLNACDVFVLPSLDRCETFGIAQLEAMSCGKPVVASDLPTGVRAVTQDGVTGALVPPGNADALAGALNRLLGDVALRARLGAAARERVGREFRADLMVSRTLDVYRDVVRD
jgi:rhamnosyl/mannosyltransferase